MFIYQRVKWIIGMGWDGYLGDSGCQENPHIFRSWTPYAPRNKYVHLRLRRVFEIRRACWYKHNYIYTYVDCVTVYVYIYSICICISYTFICHKWSTGTFWKNNHPAWNHECLVIFIYLYLAPVSIFQNHGGFSPSKSQGWLHRPPGSWFFQGPAPKLWS